MATLSGSQSRVSRELGRQGCWTARLVLIAFLAGCLNPQEAQGLGEFIPTALKVLRDLPDLGEALKAAVKSIFHPAFQPRNGRARNGFETNGDTSKTYCYEEIGCISITEDFHHQVHRPINLAPLSRNEINVSFRITSQEDTVGVVVPWSDVRKALESSFKPSRKTKVVIHGFLNGRDMPFLEEIQHAFLRHYDVNVVWVDWTDGSIALYNRAVANARVAGLEIAYFINWLKDNMALNPADVHLIGHSLGSHVSGYAGERITGLGRITGLDPAEPFFQHLPRTVRLDSTDAKFVDIIHTDSDSILNLGQGFGLRQPIGHLDFYPNGGRMQPGCRPPLAAPLGWLFKRANFTKVWHLVEDALGCNHMRAAELFSDSIGIRCPYMAFKCESIRDYTSGKCVSCGADGKGCAPMGIHADAWTGIGTGLEKIPLFASTGKGPNYCKYHYEVSLELGVLPGLWWDWMGELYASFTSENGQKLTFDLTSGRSKRFSSRGKYTFFLEHSEDIGHASKALVKWVRSQRETKPSELTTLSLSSVSIRNVDTFYRSNRSGRSDDVSSTVTFCAGVGRFITIKDQETVHLTASKDCLTAA